MLTFTVCSTTLKKIGRHILKRHQTALQNLLFLIKGGLVLQKNKLEALFKALRELFICYSWFYRTAIKLYDFAPSNDVTDKIFFVILTNNVKITKPANNINAFHGNILFHLFTT